MTDKKINDYIRQLLENDKRKILEAEEERTRKWAEKFSGKNSEPTPPQELQEAKTSSSDIHSFLKSKFNAKVIKSKSEEGSTAFSVNADGVSVLEAIADKFKSLKIVASPYGKFLSEKPEKSKEWVDSFVGGKKTKLPSNGVVRFEDDGENSIIFVLDKNLNEEKSEKKNDDIAAHPNTSKR